MPEGAFLSLGEAVNSLPRVQILHASSVYMPIFKLLLMLQVFFRGGPELHSWVGQDVGGGWPFSG